MPCPLLKRRYKTRWKNVFYVILAITMTTLVTMYYRDNDKSLWPIPHYGLISNTYHPYVKTFPDRQFGPDQTNKVILLWTKYFETYEWLHTIPSHTKHCPKQCTITNNRDDLPQSDAVLFHFTDKDLFLNDLPTKRLLSQVWALFINEPNIFVQESFTPWANVFNWTISYRRHSTVFMPYGMYEPIPNELLPNVSRINPPIYPAHHRDKMAYAVVSRCADDAERYRLVNEISQHINVDYYGECGSLKCEIKHNSCLPPNTLRRYRFRLAFEDSNCRDYVTEKFWDTLSKGIIPVVNWKAAQRDVPVPPKSYINVYDFPNIKSLAEYLTKVSRNSTLFQSYFKWRDHFQIYTSFWNSFCNFCTALYDKSVPAKVYTDLEGWLRDDYCQRFTFQNQIRRLIKRFLFDGNLVDLRIFN
ncbi:alpha-(1,3)-fucosyltransferase 7-like [Mytilus trossulus]|uniref:alpha-(1,3)-fucosyltransferase 7-like n=1 Tax=Mytilus trossulus TaxID=6551 RepID=UPI0030041AAA